MELSIFGFTCLIIALGFNATVARIAIIGLIIILGLDLTNTEITWKWWW